jgi:glycosyltransferase involved in cell wall biosynthesis
LQYLPFKEKLISPFRIIAPFVFKNFDLSKFDVVIVSATGAYSPNGIKIKNQKSKIKNAVQICYSHTPPRYLYGYATAREWKKNLIFRVIGEIGNHFLRLVDFKSSQNVDYFIANSKNVGERIKKFYRREAEVIYPPVAIDGRRWKMEGSNLKIEDRRLIHPLSSTIKRPSSIFYHQPSNKDYFLAGGRLARPKHIDLIVEACRELKVPLKVFGRAFARANIKYQISKIKNTYQKSNIIEYVGEVSDEERLELMRNAKAYIFAAEDEDFGITPVEAMSVGTPVIAYKSGGVVESVVDPSTSSGRFATGLFFDELTVEGLKRTIQQFNNLTINPSDCIKQAGKFSKERFKKEIKEFVESKLRLI